MNASGPIEFYLIEVGRVVVPAAGISFVLAAVIRTQDLGSGVARRWLIGIICVWLFVTLTNRLLLSAPVRNRFLPAAIHDYTTAHRVSLYFATTPFLWITEEILILAFGTTFFFALRSNARRNI